LRSSFKSHETKSIHNYEKGRVPYSHFYRIKNAREELNEDFSPATVVYRFANSARANLGDRPLLSGRLRIYSRREGSSVFLGEGRVNRVPVGDTVSVPVGRTNDVRAKRELIDRNRSDVRRDKNRRPQLYDELRTLRYTIENQTDDPAEIRLVEPMHGQWMIQDPPKAYSAPTNRKIVLDPTIESGETRRILLKYKQLNIIPDKP
ncbi:MAG: hypothetical protein ABEK50_14975, partial [bacterium]